MTVEINCISVLRDPKIIDSQSLVDVSFTVSIRFDTNARKSN